MRLEERDKVGKMAGNRGDCEANREPLIPEHGGYRKLKSFQLARLTYDVTVRFCDRYIGRAQRRMQEQMVQAARSGVQNIAEGSQASGTSRKIELTLTNVARASLEELRLDYEDFLRQRGLPQWEPNHPALKRFKARRCASVEEFKVWVDEERTLAKGAQTNTDLHRPTRTAARKDAGPSPKMKSSGPSVPVGESPCSSVPSSAALAANGALSLLNLCCHLLDRQIAVLAEKFEREGGFAERMNRIRRDRRNR